MFSPQDLKANETHFGDKKVGDSVMQKQLQSIENKSVSTSIASVTAEVTLVSQSHISKRDWHFLAAFGYLSLINLMCAIDATILSVALPPSWASFSHIFGRKPILLLALTIFTIGAVVSALANSFTLLLVGRSVQGIGGGGLMALTYVIVTDMVTLRDRGKWFSIISLQWAIGSVTGPVIGGAFTEKSTWRWIFWLNLSLEAAYFKSQQQKSDISVLLFTG
ncbi:hypothetical protein ACMFMG_011999 [Clarireedia jacksonii]